MPLYFFRKEVAGLNRVLCVSSSERITEFLHDVFGHGIADSLVESPTVEQAQKEL